jgi:hypothetical protein
MTYSRHIIRMRVKEYKEKQQHYGDKFEDLESHRKLSEWAAQSNLSSEVRSILWNNTRAAGAQNGIE